MSSSADYQREWKAKNRARVEAYSAARRHDFSPKPCVVCGDTFKPRREHDRYCGEPCRNRRPRKPSTTPRRVTFHGIRVCPCGQEFEWAPRYREKFCSKRCASDAHAGPKSIQWRCEVPWHTCEYCGSPFVSRIPKAKFCSVRCKPNWRPTPPRTRECKVCGTTFTRQGRGSNSATCSKKCRNRWEATRPSEIARRRLKRDEREAFIASGERFANWEIFVRDNWICHICSKHIPRKKWPHPLSATLDHLVPVNGPEKGQHTRLNVRAAHFKCNYERREIGPAQMILFGEIAA